MYRFKVTVRFENDAEVTYFIETTAGNEKAAENQIETLVEESLVLVEVELVEAANGIA